MLIHVLCTALLLIQMCSLLDGFDLGASCETDNDCSTGSSRCHIGTCSCLPYYAQYNSTLCLQSTLLGFECQVAEQCSQKVANSSCIEGTCQCERGFLQFRRHTCLTPAKLGDICYSDTHCRLWDSDTHCNFLIQNLFGKCVCNQDMRATPTGSCVPELPMETIAAEQNAAEAKPMTLIASPEVTSDTSTENPSTTISKGKKPFKPNTSIFINRSPIKFPSISNSKPSQQNTDHKSGVHHQASKKPSHSATVTGKPVTDARKKVTRPPTVATQSTTPGKPVVQEKISTDLEPPSSARVTVKPFNLGPAALKPLNSVPATLKPFKATITFVEKSKPGIGGGKPSKYGAAVFLKPTSSSFPFTATNYPTKFTILQEATTDVVPKLTTWIINDVGSIFSPPTSPTKFKPPPSETTPSKNNFPKIPFKRPIDQFTNIINVAAASNPIKPTQYSTIKLGSLNRTLDQAAINKFNLNKYVSNPSANHVTLTTTSPPSVQTHGNLNSGQRRTTQAPFLRHTTLRSPQPTVLASTIKDQILKTTPKNGGLIKHVVSSPTHPTELTNVQNPFFGPFKLKDHSKPAFGVTLVKPTHEVPTTSTWIRPVTPGSSNIITKIIASPGPAALYTLGPKVSPEKEPVKVSLGMPCKSHKQCTRADPESRCMNGICDCVKPRNNTTGAYCNAFNRGCHPNTFQCKSSGKCISWFFVCDGRRDCVDGSDEACGGRNGGGCPELGFRCGKLEPAVCISQAARCDGAWDCPGGEDEANCTASVHQDCPPHTYKCSSGQCVPEYEYCNAAAACKDGTDELAQSCSANWDTDVTTLGFCPFRCNNGRCRSSAVTCSGKDGCGDDSDEAKCHVCRCAKIS